MKIIATPLIELLLIAGKLYIKLKPDPDPEFVSIIAELENAYKVDNPDWDAIYEIAKRIKVVGDRIKSQSKNR